MTQKIIDFKQYTERPPKVAQARLDQIDAQLEDLADSSFGVEQLPKKMLQKERALHTYPKISPEFLKMHNHATWKPEHWQREHTIHVPRFGVYSLDNPNMTIEVGYGVGTYGNEFCFRVSEPRLPRALINHLARSSEIFRDGETGNLLSWTNGKWLGYTRSKSEWKRDIDPSLPKKTRKKIKRVFEDYKLNLAYNRYDNRLVRLGSNFNGIVPTKIKQRVEEARRFFQDNIFLVAETKPEEWSIQTSPESRIVRDPLLLGVIDNDCFYIDEFNTTPLEDYVKREFTE